MKKRSLKKGFTLVELVVVIAVIAVLAAVSVGAYFGITETANLHAAKTHIKQLNEMLVFEEILTNQENNNKFFHEARRDVQKQGLDIEGLEEFGSYKYGWDSKIDEFILIDMNSYNEEKGSYKVVAPSEYEISYTRHIFLLASSESELLPNFSYYLRDDFNSDKKIKVGSGIDTGLADIDEITFKSDSTSNQEETIIINTNLFKTSIIISAAEKETIYHYGYSHSVDITKVANNSYHELGTVGVINLKEGHVEVESSAEVFVINSSTEFTNSIDVKSGKRTPKYNVSNCDDVLTGQDLRANSKIIPDLKDVYRVCGFCGHALNYLGKDHKETCPEPIGWLENDLDLEEYNDKCSHNFLPSNTGETRDNVNFIFNDTCKDCHFTFLTDEARHYFVLIDMDEDSSTENYAYGCNCGCDYFSNDVPIANVRRMNVDDYTKAFKNYIDIEKSKDEDKLVFAEGKTLSVTDVTSFNVVGEISNVHCGYSFESVDGPQNKDANGEWIGDSKQSTSFDKYKGWIADFVISFNREVGPNEISLWGQYSAFGDDPLAFSFGDTIQPNVKLPLLTSVFYLLMQSDGGISYELVADLKEFRCGATNHSDNHKPDPELAKPATKMIVELGLINPEFKNDSNFSDLPYYQAFADERVRNSEYYHTINLFPFYFNDDPVYLTSSSN